MGGHAWDWIRVEPAPHSALARVRVKAGALEPRCDCSSGQFRSGPPRHRPMQPWTTTALRRPASPSGSMERRGAGVSL